MRRSWILVPRPRVSKSRPVAIGSSVPQCPTFFIWRRRRTIATTSCDVIPAALSTSRTPSGVAVNDMANLFQNFVLNFGQRSAHPGAGRQLVAASAEFLADRANVRGLRFGTHTDPHPGVGQFFEEHGDNDALDRADMIDESFVVLRPDAQFRRHLQTQAKTGDLPPAFKPHRPEELAQEFGPAAWITFVKQLAHAAHIHAAAEKLRANLERARRRVRVLKRAGICRDGDEE